MSPVPTSELSSVLHNNNDHRHDTLSFDSASSSYSLKNSPSLKLLRIETEDDSNGQRHYIFFTGNIRSSLPSLKYESMAKKLNDGIPFASIVPPFDFKNNNNYSNLAIPLTLTSAPRFPAHILPLQNVNINGEINEEKKHRILPKTFCPSDREDLQVTVHLYIPSSISISALSTTTTCTDSSKSSSQDISSLSAAIVARACSYVRQFVGIQQTDMSVLHFTSPLTLSTPTLTTTSTTNDNNNEFLNLFISMWNVLENCYRQQHSSTLGLSLETHITDLISVWENMSIKPHCILVVKDYPFIRELKSFAKSNNVKISITSKTQDIDTSMVQKKIPLVQQYDQTDSQKERQFESYSDSTLLLSSSTLRFFSSDADKTHPADSVSSQYYEPQFLVRYDIMNKESQVLLDTGYLVEASLNKDI